MRIARRAAALPALQDDPLRGEDQLPEQGRGFSGLKLSPSDLYGNVVAAGKLNHALERAKLDRPVDPAEWAMMPQAVNAYYNPMRNEIVFPEKAGTSI
jgi:predicted metalloendopeptidase